MDEETAKGFVIRCGVTDSEDVIVSNDQAEKMANACDYFVHIFAHGTRETSDRILIKPDWTARTAQQLVQLLTEGETAVADKESCRSLKEATQQLLIDPTFHFIPDFVTDGKLVSKKDASTSTNLHIYLEKLEEAKGLTITLEMPNDTINCDTWFELLQNDIVIANDRIPSVGINLPPSQRRSTLLAHARLPVSLVHSKVHFDTRETRFHLTGSSITKLCRFLRLEKKNLKMRPFFIKSRFFQLGISGSSNYYLEEKQTEISKTGAKIGFDEGMARDFYLPSPRRCTTITGTTTQLSEIRDALKVLPVKRVKRLGNISLRSVCCSLRIDNPSPADLHRMANAVKHCKANPNTLGVSLATNSFYAVKTIEDMLLMLDAMTNQFRRVGISGEQPPLKLITLQDSRGVF